MDEMLSLESVYKSFGAVRVLEDISLRLERGQSLCIIGPSGCGKSTLLKVISLITNCDRGTVRIGGTSIERMSLAERNLFRSSTTSYSFQEPLLLPFLNALDNLLVVLSPVKKDDSRLENEAIDVLSRLGLAERLEHYPSALSVGEKKRVDLARAIVKDPKLLVADEPLSNLDPDTAQTVMNLFKERTHEGMTVVYSSVTPSDGRFADQTFLLTRPN